MRDPASMLRMATVTHYPQTVGTNPVNAPSGVRRLGFAAVSVALLSALTVFVSLWERDHSLLLAANNQLSHASSAHLAAGPSLGASAADSLPASDSVTRVTVPTAVPASAERVSKDDVKRYFTVARSRRFQQVGPVLVSLGKVDVRHKLYDVSVLADGRRVDHKHVSIDSPVRISINRFQRPLEFVVDEIRRDSISGYLSEPQSVR